MSRFAPEVNWKDERFLPEEEQVAGVFASRVAHEVWEKGHFYRDKQVRPLILRCLKGELNCSVSGQKIRILPGDAILLVSGLSVDMKILETSEVLAIAGGGPNCHQRVDELFGRQHQRVQAGGSARIAKLFDLLVDIAFTGGPHRESRCAHVFEALLLELHAHWSSDRSSQFGTFATWVRCKDFMDTNFLKTTTVAECARACGVDRSYLSRLAQQYTSGTAKDYLQNLRLAKAAELLASSEQTITQIAIAGGWSDAFVFSKAFRKRYGCPPSQLRRTA